MKLTFNDRIAIIYGPILPNTGSVKTMVTAREIKAKVAFTKIEEETLNIKAGADGSLSYTASKDVSEYWREVSFDENEKTLLKAGAEYLDEHQQVAEAILSTVETLLCETS